MMIADTLRGRIEWALRTLDDLATDRRLMPRDDAHGLWIGIDDAPYELVTAAALCQAVHMCAYESSWPDGRILAIGLDADALCVRYEYGWSHYRYVDGDLSWW